MHYEITYPTVDADSAPKAIDDCRDYLGHDRFAQIVKALRAEPVHGLEPFRILCSFILGIEGYPVTPLYFHVYGPDAPIE